MLPAKTGPTKPVPDLQKTRVRAVMTPVPQTLEVDASLDAALSLMRERNIRHLPIVKKGNLVGVLSEREVRATKYLSDIPRIGVAELMNRKPVTLPDDSSLYEVITEMIARKVGSVILTTSGEVAGIFTTHDALRLLAGTIGFNIPVAPGYPLVDDDDDWMDDDL